MNLIARGLAQPAAGSSLTPFPLRGSLTGIMTACILSAACGPQSAVPKEPVPAPAPSPSPDADAAFETVRSAFRTAETGQWNAALDAVDTVALGRFRDDPTILSDSIRMALPSPVLDEDTRAEGPSSQLRRRHPLDANYIQAALEDGSLRAVQHGPPKGLALRLFARFESLASSAGPSRRLISTTVLEPATISGDSATVRYHLPGGTVRTVTLIRRLDGWRLELDGLVAYLLIVAR